MEPNNASVWMYALARASQRHDAIAIEYAMQRMAAATYADEHQYAVQKTLIDVFRRNPLPDEFFTVAASIQSNSTTQMLTQESSPYAASIAIVMALALPGYQTLLAACKPQVEVPLTEARSDECAKIGRLMAAKGSTLIANRIGFALLRITRTYTNDDVKLARVQGWIWEKSINLYTEPDNLPTAEKLIARMDDQYATGSELEAMRRELVRENTPLEPPAGWVDPHSPLSAEQLERDRAASTHPG
jgi:hypothetical protein